MDGFDKVNVYMPAGSLPVKHDAVDSSWQKFKLEGFHNKKRLCALLSNWVKLEQIKGISKRCESIDCDDMPNGFSQKFTSFYAAPEAARVLLKDPLKPVHYHSYPILKEDEFDSYVLSDFISINNIPEEVSDRKNVTNILARAFSMESVTVNYTTNGMLNMADSDDEDVEWQL